jgi:hypothetical protein
MSGGHRTSLFIHSKHYHSMSQKASSFFLSHTRKCQSIVYDTRLRERGSREERKDWRAFAGVHSQDHACLPSHSNANHVQRMLRTAQGLPGLQVINISAATWPKRGRGRLELGGTLVAGLEMARFQVGGAQNGCCRVGKKLEKPVQGSDWRMEARGGEKGRSEGDERGQTSAWAVRARRGPAMFRYYPICPGHYVGSWATSVTVKAKDVNEFA